MTNLIRLIFHLFLLNILLANSFYLEKSYIPKINCKDLNSNGFSDFIAVNSSSLPREIYFIEKQSNNLKILDQYSMEEEQPGYFSDMLFGDFDNNGVKELIAVAFQDGKKEIFYIFSFDKNNLKFNKPKIISIANFSNNIIYPQNLYLIHKDVSNSQLFLLTQGSPKRLVIMCEYKNGKIYNIGSIGKKFLNDSQGPISISTGNFDNDKISDIFILSNGKKPEGYFVYSNGNEKKFDLQLPRLSYLYKKGIDINFDGIDDLVMINRKNELMSNIWENTSIPILENKVNNILINANNGLIYLYCIDKLGITNYYTIDPLTKVILTTDYYSFDMDNVYNHIYSLFTKNEIFYIGDGQKYEFWSYPISLQFMSENPPEDYYQKIYKYEPDYIINVNELFKHNIRIPNNNVLLNFKGEYLPKGMEFNLNDITLEWSPTELQLGFHELSYKLDLRKMGDLKLEIEDGKKIVSQTEEILEKNKSHLVYVNDKVKFSNDRDTIIIVNTFLHEWIIPIDDYNVDTQLKVKQIHGSKFSKIKLLNPKTILIQEDSLFINKDIIEINNVVLMDTINENIIAKDDTLKMTYKIEEISDTANVIDTTKIKFEGIEERRSNYTFAEEKLESEKDPLKKKKLETSVEEFKNKEQEYLEKLKTHVKIVKDGKNIWIHKDSLNIASDSLNIASDSLNIASDSFVDKDSLIIINNNNENIDITLDSLNSIEFVDNNSNTKLINNDTLITNVNYIEKAIQDSQFQKIDYKKIIQHQAKFLWKPDTLPNEYNFLFVVDDGYSTDTLNAVIIVHPELDLSNNITEFICTVNKPFTTNINVIQNISNPVYSYTLIDAPDNMRITESGIINWIPLATQVDNYSFEVIVSDGIASSKLNYNIYVNAPPVISSRPPRQIFINKNETFSFPLKSFDLNNNAILKWKLLNGPKNMNLSQLGILDWFGSTLDHHPYEIQLSDGIDSVKWSGSIYVNAIPVIISNPVKIIKKTESYIYPLSARDDNFQSPLDPLIKNKVQFIIGQGPAEMLLDGKNVLRWESIDKKAGEYNIFIIASDGVDETKQEFTLLVNSFPIITSLDSIVVEIGDTLFYQIEAYDLNSKDTLTYFLDGMLSGMELNNKSGKLFWIPKENNLGKHIFNLQVRDGHGSMGTNKELTIFVYKAPKFTGNLLSEAFTGLEYSAFITAEDMFGEKLKTEKSVVIDSATFQYYYLSDYAHHFRWTPREVDIGTHKMVIKLTDKYGFSTLFNHKINVFMNPCVQCDNDQIEAPINK